MGMGMEMAMVVMMISTSQKYLLSRFLFQPQRLHQLRYGAIPGLRDGEAAYSDLTTDR
jgi:hypothetical protein